MSTMCAGSLPGTVYLHETLGTFQAFRKTCDQGSPTPDSIVPRRGIGHQRIFVKHLIVISRTGIIQTMIESIQSGRLSPTPRRLRRTRNKEYHAIILN